MTIADILHHATEQLHQAEVPDPALDAAMLLSAVLDMPMLEMKLRSMEMLTKEQEQRFSSLLLLRAKREPLQYVLKTQCFYGLDLTVDERVLIPRQETETLCEMAIRFLSSHDDGKALDLCTGSGAIAITIASQCPHIEVFATDVSEDALSVARLNAKQNDTIITFVQGDLFAGVEGQRFDVIVSNPPYIPSKECETLQQEVRFEPILALDGGDDGLDFYRRIAVEAKDHLLPKGRLYLEVGDHQAMAVCELLTKTNAYKEIGFEKDLYGLARIVCATMK